MARILVIEDQAASRDMLVSLLAYHDHLVLEARDGSEGLALTLIERPDLVIADILMPGMDGYEFARRVRADERMASTRVMFYTATYLIEEVRDLAVSCGVSHVLAKPADPETILDVVAAALATPPPEGAAAPIDEADRTYLRLLAQTLHRKIDELKVEARARASAEAEIRRQAERAHIQAEVSRALAGVTHDYQAALDLTARMLAEVIGDGAIVRILSDDRASFTMAAMHHRDPGELALLRAMVDDHSVRPDVGQLGRVIQTGQPALVPTMPAEDLKPQVAPALQPLLERYTAFSLLAAPLRAIGQTIGVIVMRRELPPGQPYSADDLAFLQDLADRAGLAIANARLYAEQQRNTAELEARVARRTAELRQRTGMIDLAGDAIIIRDYVTDTISYWNHGAERMYGWPAGEVSGQYIHHFLKTEFPMPLDQIKADLLRAGSWEGELVHTCRDGRRITVLSRWTLELGAAGATGEPTGFLEINTDITARKRAEAALQQARDDLERRVAERTAELARSEKEFRTLADNALVGVFRTTIGGEVIYANETLARMMAFDSVAELRQQSSIARYRRPEDRVAILDALRRGDKMLNYEVDMLTKTGEILTVLASLSLEADTITGTLIDITDRKRVEVALRDSEERLRTVTDTARVGLVIVGAEHRYRYVNRSYVDVLRLPDADLVGRRVADVLAPVYESQVRPRLERAFQGERVTYELVVPAAGPGTEERFYAVTYEPSVERREPVVVVVVVDITEQKRSEVALRRSEERFSKAFRSNPAAMMITRMSDGMIIDVNHSCEHLLGYRREELVDHADAELNVLFDSTDRQEIVRRLRADGAVQNYETKVRARSGELLYALFSQEVIELEGEACILSIVYDLTARKQAEEQIRRLNAELEQRVEERTSQLATINEELMTTNSYLEIEIAERTALEEQIRQNARRAQALADLSGALAEAQLEFQSLFATIVRRISDLIGDTCVLTLLSGDGEWLEMAAMYHPDPAGLEFMRALMDSAPYRVSGGLAGNVVQSGEALILPVIPPEQVRAQIQAKYVPYVERFGMSSVLIVPLRARGEILGTLGLARDRPGRPYTLEDQALLQELADRAGMAIENSRLFDEVRVAREEAERANLAKSEFLASMSHELRTPLNAIIGFTGTLLMKLPGPLTGDQEKQLKTVQGSARHLLSLINDILDLAKIESGKLKVYPEPVVCQEVLDEVIASLRPLAEQKGLRFAASYPADQIVLQTDRRALSQIIINLANNAIKFTERGEVVVSMRRATNDQRPKMPGAHSSAELVGPSSSVEFTVRDTGVGIKPEDQRRLFRAFEQVGANGANRREGTGLGLHLSLRLAQLVGGRIEFESEHGVGSTFTLVVPGL